MLVPDRIPAISVIMASYNHAAYVSSAIQSVLDQTVRDIELIIVDDGSTDGTAEVIRRFEDPRIRLHAIAENRSVHGRNHALRHAKGNFIAFQNSDDLWAPDKLSSQLALMNQEQKLEAVFTDVSFIDERSAPSDGIWAANLFKFKKQSQATWLRQFFDSGNCLAIPSAMARRSTLEAIGGFRETLVQLSDLDLWIRLAARGTFAQAPAPLTQLRIRANNLSAPSPSANRRTILEWTKVLGRFAEPAQLALYPEVFPDLPQHRSAVLQLAELARHAAGQTESAKLFFADKLFEKLFDNPNHRAEVTRALGAVVFSEFVDRRRHLDIGFI